MMPADENVFFKEWVHFSDNVKESVEWVDTNAILFSGKE